MIENGIEVLFQTHLPRCQDFSIWTFSLMTLFIPLAQAIKSLPIITHHYPSLPIIAHHYPSLPIITHHYPLPIITHNYPLPIIEHHYPSLPITTYHYPSLHITTHRYLSLPITTHYLSSPITTHYLSLNITTHHYPSLPIIIHHYTSLPIATYHYPSLPIIIHHYPSLHIMITTHHYPSLHTTTHYYIFLITLIFHFWPSDNRPPVVRLSPPLAKISTAKTMTFRWTSDEMAYYQCAVDSLNNLVSCGSGNNGEWTTPTLDDGNRVFFLTAKDEVGNKAATLKHRWNIGRW